MQEEEEEEDDEDRGGENLLHVTSLIDKFIVKTFNFITGSNLMHKRYMQSLMSSYAFFQPKMQCNRGKRRIGGEADRCSPRREERERERSYRD